MQAEGEGNRAHIPMLGRVSRGVLYTLESKDRDEVANPAMVESEKHPFPEYLEVKKDSFGSCLVELGT
jgi:hypothetical protein